MAGQLHTRLGTYGGWLLALSVVLAYAPSLADVFLNYDDPWLIESNPFYAERADELWHATWLRFDADTRHALGAEYLPLRDLSHWLETRLFGVRALPMRIVNLLLYLGAVLLVRASLRRVLADPVVAELAAWSFALHPVHVESVAWLAGRKDVLALLFIGLALRTQAGPGTRTRGPLCGLWLACASLSKSMSVAALGLFVAQDLLARRRPSWDCTLAGALAVALTLPLHLRVGEVMGMVSEPAGGTRLTAFITMGPVWLRYLGLGLDASRLSVVHDVPNRAGWDALALAGCVFVVTWFVVALLALRRDERRWLASWLWFFVPLAPVSQFLVPLQNRMADRYMWLSIMALGLMLGWGVRALLGRHAVLARGLAAVVLLALLVASSARAALFCDSVSLFADATLKTQLDPIAPYQLGKALQAQGRDQDAMAAFVEALRRAPPDHRQARRATNNLAKLLAEHGRIAEAELQLRRRLEHFPGHPKLSRNLIKLLRATGRHGEAARVQASIIPEPELPVEDRR